MEELLKRLQGGKARRITAIVGPPGAGKSTLSAALARRLNADRPGTAAILSQDGFHLDDMLLDARGIRARKGAPDTYDVAGLAHMLGRIAAGEEVIAPVFDRAIEIARAGAEVIPAAAREILVEGNWLLLDEAPWSMLRPHFGMTVMLTVPEDELRRRLELRWRDLSDAERTAKIDGNDLPNARRVREGSCAADFVIADQTQAAGVSGAD